MLRLFTQVIVLLVVLTKYKCNCFDLEDSQLSNCGASKLDSSGLIHGGYESNRTETPWKAAIFKKEKNIEKKYICGGSLISSDLVITAAHCVNQKVSEKPIDIKKLRIVLGANDISDSDEYGIQIAYVKELIIHEDWDPLSEKYNDDIALIRLNSRVEFNALIQPICLMTLNQNVNFGKVAGWGETDDYETISDIAKIVEFETIETIQCVLDNYLFGKFAWKDSFCAHSKTSGVCSGDSGSGFYVEIEGKTYLKGIVSSTVLKRCTENAIALYTDYTKYYKFIKDSFRQQSNSLEFNCYSRNYIGSTIYNFILHDFIHCDVNLDNFNFYTHVSEIKTNISRSQNGEIESILLSKMKKFLIFGKNVVKNSFPNLKYMFLNLEKRIELTRKFPNFINNFDKLEYMNLINLKTDYDSENLLTNSTNLKYLEIRFPDFSSGLPADILHGMTKLLYLSIDNSNYLSKYLHDSFFESLSNLQILSLSTNKIDSLPENIFNPLKKLKELSLHVNFLEELPVKIFFNLLNLEIIDLYSNKIKFLQGDIFSKNVKLWRIRFYNNKIKILPENIFKSLTQLKTLDMGQNEIEVLPRNLFQNNINLETISVWGNKLKEINVDFRNLPKLYGLSIGSSRECLAPINFRSTSAIHEKSPEILKNCSRSD